MNALRTVKKTLTRAERYLDDGVKALAKGTEAAMEARYEREFAAPVRKLVGLVSGGGVQLPPRELARLARLQSIVSRAVAASELEELASAAIATEGRWTAAGGGDERAGDPGAIDPPFDPAVMAQLLGPEPR